MNCPIMPIMDHGKLISLVSPENWGEYLMLSSAFPALFQVRRGTEGVSVPSIGGNV